jgi:hypothetical protein
MRKELDDTQAFFSIALSALLVSTFAVWSIAVNPAADRAFFSFTTEPFAEVFFYLVFFEVFPDLTSGGT